MEQLLFHKYRYDPDRDFLGRGAFADIYRAYDVLLERYVALKFYRPTENQAQSKYDVLNEMKRMIQLGLSHPNLITYYDALLMPITDSLGRNFPVQIGVVEYANGKEFLQAGSDFKAFVSRLKPQPDVLKDITIQILRGLLHLEQRQIVHRDLKPANILMHRQPGGEWIAKIADFGLSKNLLGSEESTIHLKGTIEYMAPEQFFPHKYGINQKVATNADLWALGAILYEIFTGQLPFGRRSKGSTDAEIVAQADNFDPNALPLHTIPAPFRQVIARCLVKHAAHRAQSAQELLNLLQDKTAALYEEGTKTTLPPPPVQQHTPPPPPKKQPVQHTPPPPKTNTPATHTNPPPKSEPSWGDKIYKGVVFTALALLAIWILQQFLGDPFSGLFNNDRQAANGADTLTTALLAQPLLNLGEFTQGKAIQRTVYLKNTGNNPLNITHIFANSFNLKTDWQPKTPILPTDSAAITFVLNTQNLTGAYTDSILVYANTLTNPTRLLLNSYVKKTFIPAPDDYAGIKVKLKEVLSFYHQHRYDTLYYDDIFANPLKRYYNETGYVQLDMLKKTVAYQNSGSANSSAETLQTNSLNYIILDGNFLADYTIANSGASSGWFGSARPVKMEAEVTYPDFKIVSIRQR
ncbi:MAG TPA: protein kinase [Chitinophagales bacterium]|nr:protein kinase [Chitinophagales bacterium]HRK29097.1 protein kinase [Chitinophagales bacterium]